MADARGKRSLGHNGHRWRVLRQQVIARDNGICWICGKPGANTGDHVIPVSLGGRPLDPANVRAAHLTCNSRRGNGKRVVAHSRDW